MASAHPARFPASNHPFSASTHLPHPVATFSSTSSFHHAPALPAIMPTPHHEHSRHADRPTSVRFTNSDLREPHVRGGAKTAKKGSPYSSARGRAPIIRSPRRCWKLDTTTADAAETSTPPAPTVFTDVPVAQGSKAPVLPFAHGHSRRHHLRVALLHAQAAT
ncbi:hypothetical protein BIW11_03222 [Tropilaelaps mercedesae]|uniref:Uncharacterized protein n=1 Tax=Tropilaelaps mercedesae TaxID=418985 RepID=A0A1V9XQ73_9ACAR|nr:hypothetical protein BIW11_03222 [Tropilaelaps mercedesae]